MATLPSTVPPADLITCLARRRASFGVRSRRETITLPDDLVEERDRVADGEQAGGVDDHHVDLLGEFGEQRAHPLRSEQDGGVGRRRRAREDPQAPGADVDVDERLVERLLADQHRVEPDADLLAQPGRHLGAAQVSVDEDHVAFVEGVGERQVDGDGRLAVLLDRAGHHQGRERAVDVEVGEAGAQRLEGLAHVHARGVAGEGVVGDHRQHRRVEQVLQLAGFADAAVEAVEQRRQRGRDQQRQDQRDHGVAFRPRRDRRRGGHRGFDDRRRPGLGSPGGRAVPGAAARGLPGTLRRRVRPLPARSASRSCRSMLWIALDVRVCATARAKALAMRAASTGFESWAVIVRKLPSLSSGLVGATVMWLSSPLASEGGRPSRRAARRPTTVVVIRVCASPMSDLELIFENSGRGAGGRLDVDRRPATGRSSAGARSPTYTAIGITIDDREQQPLAAPYQPPPLADVEPFLSRLGHETRNYMGGETS